MGNRIYVVCHKVNTDPVATAIGSLNPFRVSFVINTLGSSGKVNGLLFTAQKGKEGRIIKGRHPLIPFIMPILRC